MAPFTHQFSRLRVKVKRLDEFIKGAEEILSRKPNVGKPTKNPHIFALKMQELAGNPPVTLYYCYTDSEVVFLLLNSGDDSLQEIIL